MNYEKIGNFIADCRKEKGYTQDQIGKLVGVSVTSVSKWERGLSIPDAPLWEKICEVYGSFQHAQSAVTLANSKKYNLVVSGRTNIIRFTDATTAGKYDNMQSVDCTYRHTLSTDLDNKGANRMCRKLILGHSFGNDITDGVYNSKTIDQLIETIDLLD